MTSIGPDTDSPGSPYRQNGAFVFRIHWYHIPVQASPAIAAVLIGSSVIASLIATRKAAD